MPDFPTLPYYKLSSVGSVDASTRTGWELSSSILTAPSAQSDHQGTPADQAGTQQEGERLVGADLAQRERIARIGNRGSREAAVAGVTGEERAIAKILLVCHAVRADAAGVAEPWNADALTHAEPLDTGSDRIDPTDDFVAGRDRHLRIG